MLQTTILCGHFPKLNTNITYTKQGSMKTIVYIQLDKRTHLGYGTGCGHGQVNVP